MKAKKNVPRRSPTLPNKKKKAGSPASQPELSAHDNNVLDALRAVLNFLSQHVPSFPRDASTVQKLTAYEDAIAQVGRNYTAAPAPIAVEVDGIQRRFNFAPRTGLRRQQVKKWVRKRGALRAGTFPTILFALDEIFDAAKECTPENKAAYKKLVDQFANRLKFSAKAVGEIRAALDRKSSSTPHFLAGAVRQLAGNQDLFDQEETDIVTRRYSGVWLAMRLRTEDRKILRYPLWIRNDARTGDLPRVTLIGATEADDAHGVLLPAGDYLYVQIYRRKGSIRGDWAMKLFIFYRDRNAGPAEQRAAPLTLGGLYLGPSDLHDALVARHAILHECKGCRSVELEKLRAEVAANGFSRNELHEGDKDYPRFHSLLWHEHFSHNINGKTDIPLYLTYNDFLGRLSLSKRGD